MLQFLKERPATRRAINYSLVVLVVLALFLGWWSWIAGPDTVFRTLIHMDTDIGDNQRFPKRLLTAAQSPFHFHERADLSGVPTSYPLGSKGPVPLEKLLGENDTAAFLVVKNDTIVFERYDQGYTAATPSHSFSVGKSVFSLLVGAAIDDGIIRSADQPVTDFVPELAANGFDRVTIKDLLQMSSGSDYAESGNPFGLNDARLEYTSRVTAELMSVRITGGPGQAFRYKSGDNALLALVLSRALKTKTITEYTQERLWNRLGMEYEGWWNIDHAGDGIEKTWCCLSSTARDLAKIGRLVLNTGDWNGSQVVSPDWLSASPWVETHTLGREKYHYYWWLPSNEEFLADGKDGQYLYVNTQTGVIIVRYGWSRGDLSDSDWIGLLRYLGSNVR